MTKLTKWLVPEEGGVPLLTMPNVPHDLHGLAPRTIMGRKLWDETRFACYAEHEDTCEICGQKLAGTIKSDLPLHQCHECYEVDYEKQRCTFNRLCCLCTQCVDEKTEVLTADGWRKIPEVTVKDIVACWSPKGTIEFLHPINTVVTHPTEAIEIRNRI